MKKLYLPLILSIVTLGLTAQEVHENMKVRLVELDVKVTDWAGQYISGLESHEFTVRENGRTQVVDSFEEIDVAAQSDAERKLDPTRLMLVLDLKNTSYSSMKRTIPQLKEYANTLFNDKIEMGLAVNGDGFGEVQTFTSDRDTFFAALEDAERYYQRSKYRILRPASALRPDLPGPKVLGSGEFNIDRTGGGKPSGTPSDAGNFFNSETQSLNQADKKQAFDRINDASQDKYVWSELQALRQFVNYVGAYSGKKSLILISDMWSSPIPEEDLRDIVTTCVLHKISINVLGLDKQGDISSDRYKASASLDRSLTNSSGLAGNTAGYNINGNYRKVSEMIGRLAGDATRYYRIRYYSEIEGGNYRNLKVKVPGIKRLVTTFSGYHADARQVAAADVDAQVGDSTLAEADLNLSMDTQWLDWEWTHVRKQRAFYAVGQRAYDAQGRILGERVSAGQLVRRKNNGTFEPIRLEKEYALNLPDDAAVDKLEFVVIDLNTGKKVTVDRPLKGSPQI